MRINMPASWFVAGLAITVGSALVAGMKYQEASVLSEHNQQLKRKLEQAMSSTEL